jgi:NDP-sugar pyrophosphorylase family protein
MANRHAVILAGGRGTRLRPYTVALPKPLVPVGDQPILEIIVRQLVRTGFTRATIAVNHQADLIRAYFGDGARWGIAIDYSLEKEPLGTMGPLRIIDSLPEHFLVMNGDILTDLAYGAFLDQHAQSDALFTISAAARAQSIDFGVLHVQDGSLKSFEEKPTLPYLVSMGVYGVSRSVVEWIPDTGPFGFDQLMHKLLSARQAVRVQVHDGYWLDIGRPDDYEAAGEAWARLAPRLLHES